LIKNNLNYPTLFLYGYVFIYSRLARHAYGEAEADGSPNIYVKQRYHNIFFDFSQPFMMFE